MVGIDISLDELVKRKWKIDFRFQLVICRILWQSNIKI